MQRTGAGLADTVAHFAPHLRGEGRRKYYNQIAKWVERAKSAESPRAPHPQVAPESAVLTPGVSNRSTGRLAVEQGRVAFLEAQLQTALEDREHARSDTPQYIGQLDRRVSEIRAALDAARAAAAPGLRLDRDVRAVAQAILARATLIEMLAGKTMAECAQMTDAELAEFGRAGQSDGGTIPNEPFGTELTTKDRAS